MTPNLFECLKAVQTYDGGDFGFTGNGHVSQRYASVNLENYCGENCLRAI